MRAYHLKNKLLSQFGEDYVKLVEEKLGIKEEIKTVKELCECFQIFNEFLLDQKNISLNMLIEVKNA